MEIHNLLEKVQDHTTPGFLYIDNHSYDRSFHMYDNILHYIGKCEYYRLVHTNYKNWSGPSPVLDHDWTFATCQIKHQAWQSETSLRYWLRWAKKK